jgi:hypothetical protein
MIRYFYRIEVHPIWQSLLSCPFLQLEVVHGDKCLKVLVRPEVLGTKLEDGATYPHVASAAPYPHHVAGLGVVPFGRTRIASTFSRSGFSEPVFYLQTRSASKNIREPNASRGVPAYRLEATARKHIQI